MCRDPRHVERRSAPRSSAAPDLVWLGEARCRDPFLVGGKAASLSRLAERQPVPPGFALTAPLFERAAPRPGAETTLRLPAPIRAEIASAYVLLAVRSGEDEPAVAVRSSAVDEDGRDASFAGQHETFLNVAGAEAVIEAVERCWASFTAPHAIEYRRRQGLPVDAVRVGVLVQQLVVADASAVVFSANPITGSLDEIVIDTSWGLGESIVGGTVTPDVYVVAKQDLTIRQRFVSEKRRMTVAVAGGTAEVSVPAFLQAEPALGDEQFAELARLALALEDAAGHPVDLECAYRAGRLYLLQCRPITTLGRETAGPRAAGSLMPPAPPAAPTPAPLRPTGSPITPPADFQVAWEHPEDAGLTWTIDRVHWPDPVPPLVFAIAGDALARGLTVAATAYELPVGGVRVRRINTYRYQANVPLICSSEEAAARRERSRQKLRAASTRLRETWTGEWLPEVQEHLAFWEHFDLAAASMPALVAHFDETLARADRLWEIHFLLASPMHGAISQFGRLYRELFGGGTLDAFRLLRGRDNKILLDGRALWYLSRLASALPEVRTALEGQSVGTLDALSGSDEGRDFLAEVRSYLVEFGQRGENLYLDRPAWLEDPMPVIEQVRGLMAQADRDVAGELVNTWEQNERQVEEARARLRGYPAPVAREFELLLAAAREAVALTEDHNFWIDARAMYCVRQVFLEIGRRFAAAGVAAEAADVFCLTPDELRETSLALPALDRHALVAERRAELERFRAVVPPPLLGVRPPDAGVGAPDAAPDGSPRESPRAGAASSWLRGHAASPGVARGIARVLRSPGEAGQLAPGDVLVAETLSSSWTPLFATASAVVTNTGGILSHAAVVAREYGIPAVLGTGTATALLQGGQLVEVDGDRGAVHIIGVDEQPTP
jgi:pyruvate,water dikinase